VTCSTCGTENEAGRKFCKECGSALAVACPACGSTNTPDSKFCGECGTTLVASVVLPAAAPPPAPLAERRLVTVLFADLVGYTSLSEGRDFEDVRELQSRYFETARQVAERYGGVVEKFIGDAVMAVWGTPVAQEDDAERAVRAALELVSAVTEIDAALQARAGVLTGEAAVTLGAEGQGMVTGDLVNTASRLQAAAEPGTVLVGESTKRASEAAIVYEDAGTHELKGKQEPLRLWRVTRVVAGRGGEGRAAGLEAPFVGRDRELRLVKELFHATADEGRAHLLLVSGVAGIGKSRLAWEFQKYADGLVGTVWWHRGRCLAYGDGVAYWALAEMIRMRAGIAEDEAEGEALGKLRRVVEEFVTDPEERAVVEPRLQHLLGLTERTALDKEDMFSAWRLYFERMTDRGPVALVFEDLHWADAALVEFVQHLLDWSRAKPIFVLALARPELAQRHSGFGSTIRSFTSVTLEPLNPDAIDALLRGLVPGLPDEVVERIRDRADGVPLYAVETVRMLLDRGLLEQADDGYRLSGDIDALDVPQSLHALIAARLDGLEPDERRALQDAAVLGKTFAPKGVAALSGLPESAVQPLLAGLVRKEILALDSNPRSPERGLYGFLQALVQRVAYETLSRRDRKAKHLAAAAYLADDAGIDPDEIADVIAAHYRDAFETDPNAPDADDVRAAAGNWLCRAGDRAASLAATEDARRLFDEAVNLAAEPRERAPLLERAGQLAHSGYEPELALERLSEAHALYSEAGRMHDAARVAAGLSMSLWALGRTDEAIEQGEPAFELLSRDEPDEDVAMLAAELARVHTFRGNYERAMERVEYALAYAEGEQLPRVLSEALNTKSLILKWRPHESRALLTEALTIALEHDLTAQALRAYNNLVVLSVIADRPEEAAGYAKEGFDLARRRGYRQFAASLGGMTCGDLLLEGQWDAALMLADEVVPRGAATVPSIQALHGGLAWALLERGETELAIERLSFVMADPESGDLQQHSNAMSKQILLALAEGRPADVHALAREQLVLVLEMEFVAFAGWCLEVACEAAVEAGSQRDLSSLAALIDPIPQARKTRRVVAATGRAHGLAAAAAGDDTAAADSFAGALAAARNLGSPPVLGPVLVDYGRWLTSCGRLEEAEPLLEEARSLFEPMGAVRWLERIDALLPAPAATR
jgi:class 3 adenylate cyclase/tetratricopeptide (TPR) repeat protein